MTIQRFPDATAVSECASARLAELLANKPDAVLLLAAGATPVPVYRALALRGVDVSRAWIVQLDELLGVPPTDPRSFQAFLREHWIEPLGHPPERALLLDGACADPAAEIARHAERLAQLGAPDVVLLGIGRNGHVAFNEPGTTLADGARVVELAAATRDALALAFAPGEAPRRGITLGLAELARGKQIWILATGFSKAPILQRLAQETPSPALPASLLTESAGAEVLADAAACGD